MAKRSESNPLSRLNPIWKSNENTIWLASTLTLKRNIEKFKFPNKLEADRHKQIVSLIGKHLVGNENLSKPIVIQSNDISPLQKEFLMEHFLIQSVYHAHSGEAFIFDNSGLFLTTLNINDHIQFQLMDCRGELEESWNRLIAIENSLGKHVSYAFSPKYGYLTSDFNQCGTALVVTVLLHLPSLVHLDMIDSTLEKLTDDHLNISGIQGNPTEIIGDVLVVQNNYTLGVTEENIISSIRTFATKIIVEENGAKRKILQEDNSEIKDKISRAFGILVHSYQIEAVEALNALSLLKLGIELNWIEGMSIKEVNDLFFNCRRAHLINQIGQENKPEELLHKRAEFIHQHLKNVHLTI